MSLRTAGVRPIGAVHVETVAIATACYREWLSSDRTQRSRMGHNAKGQTPVLRNEPEKIAEGITTASIKRRPVESAPRKMQR
jgi:hypothetical protein